MADEKRTGTPAREGDVLGISDTAPPQSAADRELADETARDRSATGRRRRADDVAGQDEKRDADTGADDPRGLHVER